MLTHMYPQRASIALSAIISLSHVVPAVNCVGFKQLVMPALGFHIGRYCQLHTPCVAHLATAHAGCVIVSTYIVLQLLILLVP